MYVKILKNGGVVMVNFYPILINAVIKIAFAILTAVIGFALIKFFMRMFVKSRIYKKIDDSAASFIKSFMSIALNVLLIFIIAAIVGIPTASLIAVIGSASLAIGLAVQGSLSNFAGGFVILVFKPFKVGDFITFSDSISGTVTDISIFYTTLHTVDNKKIVIPNGQISNSSVTNVTALPTRRVDIDFCVSYTSDISKVKEILLNTAKSNSLILKDNEPFVRMSKMDDSCLVFSLRVWCKTEDYWNVFFDISEQGKEALDRENIEIPFPQMDVHITK